MNCPLCNATNHHPFHHDKRRDYLRCDNCALIFVPPEQRLSPDQERAVYELHQNNPQDPGYRKFLARLFDPLSAVLSPESKGLDFGSGPGPTLSVMFIEAGFPMSIYDVFYANNIEALQKPYDFITATEVVEHLYDPGTELEKLWSLLNTGGWLGLMTKLVLDQKAFASWHYINDPTHVCFYSQQTFQWLARQWQTEPRFVDNDVVLIKKCPA